MHRKGLTLVEMMITTAIFVVISGILFMVYVGGSNSWSVGSTYITLQQQARTAMSAMINELEESSPAVVNSFVCNDNRCNGNYIEFRIPVVDNNYDYQNSIYQPDRTIKWGADDVMNNRIRFAAVTNSFSQDYAGKLVRLTNTETTPPSPPCFLTGTPILMANGTTKMIEDIKTGDMVLTFDEKNKKTTADKVKKVMMSKTDKYLLVNNHLGITANHPVYSNDQYIPIGQLRVGDALMNKDGQPEKIFSIQQIHREAVVYDLEVNPYHNYFAGGYLVHNKLSYPEAPDDPDGGGEPIEEPPLSFLDRFKLLGLAFADDIGNLGSSEDYDIKVISDYITKLEVISPATSETLIIKIHAQKNTLGNIPVEVIISSQVTFKN